MSMGPDHDPRGASPPWADLPADALGEIAGRLHDAGDLVRFRAACRPWREAPPPSRAPPGFLPWLVESYVSPDADADHSSVGVLLHSPFSTRTTRGHLLPPSALRGMEIHGADVSSGRVLAAGYSDGHGTTPALINPLDGASTSALPPLPRSVGFDNKWRSASGVVSSSGGAVVFHTETCYDWAAMKLRHGGWDWEEADVTCPAGLHETKWLHRDKRRAAALWAASATLPGVACGIAMLPPRTRPCDRHVIEFRGEILCVDMDVPRKYQPAAGSAAPESVSVQVYAMQVHDSGLHQWVERGPDHLCFFLGSMGSFAIDAREFAGSAVVVGGCAYFFCWHPKWTESEQIRGVYRCCLKTGTATVVAELPHFMVPMWFMPRPRVSPLLPRVQ